MRIRDIIIALGFEIDRNSESRVENDVRSMRDRLSGLLGTIGLTLSIAGITSAISSCVDLASEVEEMQNKFDVVFQGMTDDVEAWAQSYADAIGRNKNEIKSYLADQQNLLVGFGMTRAEGAELSKQITTLALDLASFANLDETTAVNAMSKAVMGETEAAKTLGAVLNDTTRAQAMHTLGLSGNFDALDQLTKMQVNYQAILSQSPDAVGDCERSLNSYRSTVIKFQSKLSEIKVLVGQFFMPTFQKVISYGNAGLTVLRNWLQKISDFAETVGGADKVISALAVTVGILFAVMNFGAIQKGLTMVLTMLGAIKLEVLAMFAGVLLFVLLIQDFIVFLQGNDSLLGALFEKAGIDCDVMRSKISNAFKSLITLIVPLIEGLSTILSGFFNGIKMAWQACGNDVMAVLGTAIGVIAYFVSSIAEIVGESEIVRDALYAVGIVLGALVIICTAVAGAFGIVSVAAGVLGGVISALGTVIGFLTSPIGLVILAIGALIAVGVLLYRNWEEIKEAALIIWQNICDGIGEAKDVISENINSIKETIISGFQAAIDWVRGLPAEARQWGADIVTGIADGITGAIGNVANAVGNVAEKIKSYLHFSVPDEGPLTEYESWMPDFMAGLANGIRENAPEVLSALKSLTGDMSIIANASVAAPATASRSFDSVSAGKEITQNIEIYNEFNGDRAGQQKSSEAMNKATSDSTSALARALAFVR